ncbi:hypothetical protein GGS23DRAFT_592051 [Durotheca rogersii]|uniref:uncharacterized protein n=1 Tax=Durotheca rogersii TaxID=419775 RepID=UPI0022210C89|nr:uncharacterized protein GGS23DRAFT_592051 [Durotheca rogersii]KAI5868264.1 hypothetical protein GGS23DRAFT_592051 [Durotheca rogersii]
MATSGLVTEFVTLPLRHDVSAHLAKTVLFKTAAALLAQPGCLRVRQSRDLDASPASTSPRLVRISVDWASLAAHRAFAGGNPAFADFRRELSAIVDGAPPTPYHVEWALADGDGYALGVLDGRVVQAGQAKGEEDDDEEAEGKDDVDGAHVTEILHAYFPPDVAAPQRAAAQARARAFLDEVPRFAGDLAGGGAAVLGWTVPGDEAAVAPEGGAEPPGGDGGNRALVLAIGWRSVDAHLRARDTDGFRGAIGLLRGMEGLRGMKVWHVRNTAIVASL